MLNKLQRVIGNKETCIGGVSIRQLTLKKNASNAI
jgi:hypothetical protein